MADSQTIQCLHDKVTCCYNTAASCVEKPRILLSLTCTDRNMSGVYCNNRLLTWDFGTICPSGGPIPFVGTLKAIMSMTGSFNTNAYEERDWNYTGGTYGMCVILYTTDGDCHIISVTRAAAFYAGFVMDYSWNQNYSLVHSAGTYFGCPNTEYEACCICSIRACGWINFGSYGHIQEESCTQVASLSVIGYNYPGTLMTYHWGRI